MAGSHATVASEKCNPARLLIGPLCSRRHVEQRSVLFDNKMVDCSCFWLFAYTPRVVAHVECCLSCMLPLRRMMSSGVFGACSLLPAHACRFLTLHMPSTRVYPFPLRNRDRSRRQSFAAGSSRPTFVFQRVSRWICRTMVFSATSARPGPKPHVAGEVSSQHQGQNHHQGPMAMVAVLSCPTARRTGDTTKY